VAPLWGGLGVDDGAETTVSSGLGVGSTKTQLSLIIGGGAGSFSTLSITLGGGFLGCSVTLSMICCG
jgi:hypothetical protein